MSEITEEEIARAIRSYMDDLRADIHFDIYDKDAAATGAASAVLALLQPALERARREERKKAAAVIDYRAERLRGNRKRIAQVDQHVLSIMESLAAAIRKG